MEIKVDKPMIYDKEKYLDFIFQSDDDDDDNNSKGEVEDNPIYKRIDAFLTSNNVNEVCPLDRQQKKFDMKRRTTFHKCLSIVSSSSNNFLLASPTISRLNARRLNTNKFNVSPLVLDT